ncbi:MAG: hypothetical protein ACLSUW_04180 [Akkermansia sp.]
MPNAPLPSSAPDGHPLRQALRQNISHDLAEARVVFGRARRGRKPIPGPWTRRSAPSPIGAGLNKLYPRENRWQRIADGHGAVVSVPDGLAPFRTTMRNHRGWAALRWWWTSGRSGPDAARTGRTGPNVFCIPRTG